MAEPVIKRAELDQLEYYLFPSKILGETPRGDIYDKGYLYWRNFWKGFYEISQSPESFTANEFFRQDAVACLVDRQGEIVAVHTYCFFDTQYAATRDHGYFALYNDLDFQRLKSRNFTRLMTMEYMAMRPDWRKGVVGISLAEVMVACGVKLMQTLELDASITIARVDLRVPEFAKRVGFETLRSNVSKHHIPCELMVCPAQNPAQSLTDVVQNYVNYYWSRRNDFFTDSHLKQAVSKKVA